MVDVELPLVENEPPAPPSTADDDYSAPGTNDVVIIDINSDGTEIQQPSGGDSGSSWWPF